MYQLVFKGECAPGIDEATAKANAVKLFKASDAQVQKMFSGGRVVIRNRLDGPTAEKYQGVLRKNGIIAYIEPMGDAPPLPEKASHQEPPSPVASESPSPAAAQSEPAPRPSAASGSGGNVAVEPGDRLPVAGEKVDEILSGSGLSLGKPGERLTESREVEPPMFEHLDDWTLAPPGEDLVEKRPETPVVEPDTSHLSLVDNDEIRRKED